MLERFNSDPTFIKRIVTDETRVTGDETWVYEFDMQTSTQTHHLTKVIIVNEFLAKNSTNIIERPPYSPDMAPADFFLFSKLKLLRQGTSF